MKCVMIFHDYFLSLKLYKSLQTDWTELWLLSVQSFHVLILCFIILSHRAAWNNVSGIVFISLLALMYLAPTINSYAAENYLKFAKEQYFDSNGMFISLIVSLPCAINCILFIVSIFDNYTIE